ncbi:pentapeptide repeat-containing protein [Mesorhizobium sp. Cs1321R2N1]|uniref:pentapeptide repeat-containing protein n=1 Tax=Mesorhizobium sp. Cs1321R2N1 TaxID=3015174 RepID=UPI003FA546C3
MGAVHRRLRSDLYRPRTAAGRGRGRIDGSDLIGFDLADHVDRLVGRTLRRDRNLGWRIGRLRLGFSLGRLGGGLQSRRIVGLRGGGRHGAGLIGASLIGASLVGASLVGASLVGLSLTGRRHMLWRRIGRLRRGHLRCRRCRVLARHQ